jgi:hypothetical protein
MNLIESLLFPPQMVKAILNRAQSHGAVGSQDARTAIPCELIGEIPSDGRAMGVATNQGTPVVSLFAISKISGAFRRLAETLLGRPELFVQHQDVPRHPRQEDDGGALEPQPSRGEASGIRRLFSPAQTPVDRAPEDPLVALKRRVHARLVEALDLKKSDLTALSNPEHLQQMRERCERVIARLGVTDDTQLPKGLSLAETEKLAQTRRGEEKTCRYSPADRDIRPPSESLGFSGPTRRP